MVSVIVRAERQWSLAPGWSAAGRFEPVFARSLWMTSAFVTAVLAAFAPATTKAETLRDAITAAYFSNPRLDAERARLRATDEGVSQAKSGYRPTVTGTASIGRQNLNQSGSFDTKGATNPAEYELRIEQSVFNGWQTTNAVNEAEANVRAGRENLRFTESQTLLDAATAYMDVVRDQALVSLRMQNISVLTRELRAAEERRVVKDVTLTDVAQARARRARAVSAADLAKANLRVSRANYERVIGHPAASVYGPPLHMKFLPRSLDEALIAAERESPNVISALYREQAARHAVSRAWGGLLPAVNLEASYRNRTGVSPTLSDETTAQIGGRLTVPFYRGGELHSRVRQAKHTHVSRLQEIEQARAEAQANVTAAWSRLMAARAQLRSDRVQVSAARNALEGVREEEKVGQRTLLDVLNAEQEALDAEVSLTQTRRDLVVAGYSLLSEMGRLTAGQLELAANIYDEEQHYNDSRDKWFGISITHANGRKETMNVRDGEISEVTVVHEGRVSEAAPPVEDYDGYINRIVGSLK